MADVYVDGGRMIRPFSVDFSLRPDDVEAIEVYHASEMPAEFGTTTCGAVMIWTRVPNRGTGTQFSWVPVLSALSLLVLALMRF